MCIATRHDRRADDVTWLLHHYYTLALIPAAVLTMGEVKHG
jgi:hypothetical protein